MTFAIERTRTSTDGEGSAIEIAAYWNERVTFRENNSGRVWRSWPTGANLRSNRMYSR